jgi:deazaflavin-dependent oxidoreductase (nitroreductase family)
MAVDHDHRRSARPDTPAVPLSPNPLLKRLLRLPAALYSLGAGFLLGHRFLLLRHRGRRSGRLYGTVLEVLTWDPGLGEAVVMSGFGRKAQWYKNVVAGGAVEVRIGRTRFEPRVRTLADDEAAAVLLDYERRNRILRLVIHLVLSRLAGFSYDGSERARLKLVALLPLIAFRASV